MSRDGKTLYVANDDSTSANAISQFDIADDGSLSPKSPARVAAGTSASKPRVSKIGLTPDGAHAFAVNSAQNSISRFDVGADGNLTKVGDPVAVGSGPRFLAVSANGQNLYATNNGGGTISQLTIADDGSLTAKSPAEAAAGADVFGIAISPSQPPVARFGATPAPAGSPTRFDGTASFDDDGPIVRHDWNFGDGTKLSDGGPTPTHVYAKGGVYTAVLTVTDSTGASSSSNAADSVYLDAEIIRNGGPTGSARGVVAVPGLNQSVLVKPVGGIVFIRLPGARAFTRLNALKSIPLRTTVDTARGRVELRASEGDRRTIDTAVFYDGVFRVNQVAVPVGAAARATAVVTEARLVGGSFRKCRKGGRRAGRGAVAARSKRKVRRLWGSGKGKFRTKGRNSSATVRGTKWLTVDRCDGTLTSVDHGLVAVRDFHRHKTVTVAAGTSYLARAR